MSAASELVTNVLTAPRQAFEALEARPSFLLPMMVVVLGNAALVLWYYSQVDLAWLIETTLAASGRELPADVQEQNVAALSEAPRLLVGGASAIGTGLWILATILAMSGYLALVSMLANDGYRFRQWLSLVSWSSLPAVFAIVASAVNLGVSDIEFLPPGQINPLSIAGLLGFDLSASSWLGGVLQTLDLTTVWALGLMAVGYRTWTGKGTGISAAVVAAPLAVLVGLALALAAL